MMNFAEAAREATTITCTANGMSVYNTTCNALYDMFSTCGSMRQSSENDVISTFRAAYTENPEYALKCLFWCRDILDGAGERRFFRVCLCDLARRDPEAVKRNIKFIPILGRWDDLYALLDTPCEKAALGLIKEQLNLDVQSQTPSLLAKWMASENASSIETKRRAAVTRKYLGLTPKQYRKTLSILRTRINVLERLMSENRWSEIEYDKIPSVAGFKYRNAFARHDIERIKAGKQSYSDFMNDDNTAVNAKAMFPYEIIKQTRDSFRLSFTDPTRKALDKYWSNLTNYFNKQTFDGIAIVDTSNSMTWGGGNVKPIDVAISLGMYCAEKARGPFHNLFMTFSNRPSFQQIHGADMVEKVQNVMKADWDSNTNIAATFQLILDIAVSNHCTPETLPKNLIIFSDMQFDQCVFAGNTYYNRHITTPADFANIAKTFEAHGYELPKLVFWNLNADYDGRYPMKDKDGVTYVSGFSPSLFQQIMTGKTGMDLMYETLNSPKYKDIH